MLVDESGRLKPEAEDVLKILAENPQVVLATGHGSAREVNAVVERAAELGVRNIMDAIIRVPNATEQNMMHALDIGAQGVQVPNLTTVAEVENALQKAKYVPLGTRGLATTTRAALYTLKTPDEHIRHVNNETLFVAMIENTEIAGHVSEICQIPGVDVLFIGTSDLSQSLGVPGRVHEESVQSAVREIVRKARA